MWDQIGFYLHRFSDNECLSEQVRLFEERQLDDQHEMDMPGGVDITNHEHIFRAVFEKVECTVAVMLTQVMHSLRRLCGFSWLQCRSNIMTYLGTRGKCGHTDKHKKTYLGNQPSMHSAGNKCLCRSVSLSTMTFNVTVNVKNNNNRV